MPDYYKELHELKLKQKELAKQEEDLRHKLDSLGANSPKKASQVGSRSAEIGPCPFKVDVFYGFA